MKKDDLKSLVTQMYKELLDNIDSQETASKEQVVHYLEDAVNSIKKIDDDAIDSIEHAKLAFTNAYKEIAKKSISSYKATNEKFEELEKMHQSALEEVQDKLIDLPTITEKFSEIQSHMTQEVQKANSIITQLNMQIKALEEDSNLDGLTKVFNRRALDRYLAKITKKGHIEHELHLHILDIDDFKSINDTYGHVAGDKVLIFIANLLRNTLLYKGKAVNVTISIGATKYVDGDTEEELISRADKALYNSKQQGKNQLNMEIKNGH